jgi:hypothetical protein
MSSPWQECNTDDGHSYWWNTITNETSWEKPVITKRVPPPVPQASTSPSYMGSSPNSGSSFGSNSFGTSSFMVPAATKSVTVPVVVEEENPKSHTGYLMKKGVIRK